MSRRLPPAAPGPAERPKRAINVPERAQWEQNDSAQRAQRAQANKERLMKRLGKQVVPTSPTLGAPPPSRAPPPTIESQPSNPVAPRLQPQRSARDRPQLPPPAITDDLDLDNPNSDDDGSRLDDLDYQPPQELGHPWEGGARDDEAEGEDLELRRTMDVDAENQAYWAARNSADSFITTTHTASAAEPAPRPRKDTRGAAIAKYTNGVIPSFSLHIPSYDATVTARKASATSATSSAAASSSPSAPLSSSPPHISTDHSVRNENVNRMRTTLIERKRAAESSPSPEQPPKRSKYQKPKAGNYDPDYKTRILLAAEIYKLGVLEDPYRPREDEVCLGLQAWNEACDRSDVERTPCPGEILKIILQRSAQLRSHIKTQARGEVERMGFSHDPSASDSNRELAQKTSDDYNFIFADMNSREGLYEAPCIANVLGKSFFKSAGDLGIKYHAAFNPVPLTVIALVCSAIEFCISEWESGDFVSRDWTSKDSDRYLDHLEQLFEYEDSYAAGAANLQRSLWLSGCARAKVKTDIFERSTRKRRLHADDFKRARGEVGTSTA